MSDTEIVLKGHDYSSPSTHIQITKRIDKEGLLVRMVQEAGPEAIADYKGIGIDPNSRTSALQTRCATESAADVEYERVTNLVLTAFAQAVAAGIAPDGYEVMVREIDTDKSFGGARA